MVQNCFIEPADTGTRPYRKSCGVVSELRQTGGAIRGRAFLIDHAYSVNQVIQ